jgi:hypothetical protein
MNLTAAPGDGAGATERAHLRAIARARSLSGAGIQFDDFADEGAYLRLCGGELRGGNAGGLVHGGGAHWRSHAWSCRLAPESSSWTFARSFALATPKRVAVTR